MAIDVAMSTNTTEPTIRFYDWDPATVSLGFHQKSDRIDRSKLTALGLGICRRPTGGRAVVHDRVLTYSVVVPLAEGSPSLWELYRWIGEWWASALVDLGIPVELVDEPLSRPGANFDGCFASGNRYEAVVRGRKILGSAQRRFPNAALQHGSLRIHRPRIQAREIFFEVNAREPDETTVATSIVEEISEVPDNNKIISSIHHVLSSTGHKLFDATVTNCEIELAESIEADYQVA